MDKQRVITLAGAGLAVVGLLGGGIGWTVAQATAQGPAHFAGRQPGAMSGMGGHGTMGGAQHNPMQSPAGGGPTGMMGMDASQHFIQQMIPHHEDAVTMAALAPTQAEHQELRDLAAKIGKVQAEEIDQMRQWYRDWYGTDVPPSNTGAAMSAMGGWETASLDGTQPFDKAFIEQMVPHHEMAVMMSSMALQRADRPELRTLLQSIIDSQRAEIAQMRAWYQEWYGAPLPSSGPAVGGHQMGGTGGSPMNGMGGSHMGGMGGHGMGGAGRPQQQGANPGGEPRVPGMHRGATPGSPPDAHQGHSPYAGQFSVADTVRVLSPEEVRQIRAGEGAGLAKAAELNGVPGPRHVLDLASDLNLSPDQVAKIQPIYDDMRAKAVAAGAAYLAAQEALETDFRNGRLMLDTLPARVAEVARLRGELESAHLAPHLATAAILTPDQVARYNTMRGY